MATSLAVRGPFVRMGPAVLWTAGPARGLPARGRDEKQQILAADRRAATPFGHDPTVDREKQQIVAASRRGREAGAAPGGRGRAGRPGPAVGPPPGPGQGWIIAASVYLTAESHSNHSLIPAS